MTSQNPVPEDSGRPPYYHDANNAPQDNNVPAMGQPYTDQYNAQPVPGYPSQYWEEPTAAQLTSNKMAISSLVVSITVFLLLWMVPILGVGSAIIGIVLGHNALKQQKTYKDSTGSAMAGIIVGYVSLAMSFLWSAFWLFWLIVFLSEVKM